MGYLGEVPTRKKKMVGETLRTKWKNPMESSNIKGREVAMNKKPNGEESKKKKKVRIREQRKRKRSDKKGREKTR